ncbi:hypothetical protein [Tumebacillus flagellatus]|uniref:TauD/TfdA-like domain-containing protein n=1 Tax=Tumebacillus flagellatus TaxID=1157490 RepID=A0A074LLP4_9BACL|nr:hypothetical protein [Tumebacillus flagellatus]KEO82009.1 hypothetical protein EL26_17725 [Tumebacillus flagellatus]
MIELNSVLNEEGWIEVSKKEYGSILELAQKLGRPVPSRQNGSIIDRLKPTLPENAHSKSLSVKYGLESFPFHTDGAYFNCPPRYVLLSLADDSNLNDRPTLLIDTNDLDFSEDEKKTLLRDVFIIKGGGRSFLSSILDRSVISGKTIFRYNKDIMKPAHQSFQNSLTLMDVKLRSADPVFIKWTSDKIVVIDNWRMLHGRGTSHINDMNFRILNRVLVESKGGR